MIVEPDTCTNDERGTELPRAVERRIGSHGAPVPVAVRKRVMQWHCTHGESSDVSSTFQVALQLTASPSCHSSSPRFLHGTSTAFPR